MISNALCTSADHEPSAVTLVRRSTILEVGSAFQLLVADPWTRRVTARVEAKVGFGATYERLGVIEDAPWTEGLRIAAALASRGRALGGGGLRVYATGPARDALNGSSFVEAVRSRVGLPVQILPADREAELVYRAAVRPSNGPRTLLFALGRGSVELACGRGATPEWTESLGFGASTLQEELGDDGATSAAARRAIQDRARCARAALEARGALRGPVALVLAGPTAASLAALAGEGALRVTLARVRALAMALEGLVAPQVAQVAPGAPAHAAWSASLVAALLDAFGASVARVSTATAGEGLVAA